MNRNKPFNRRRRRKIKRNQFNKDKFQNKKINNLEKKVGELEKIRIKKIKNNNIITALPYQPSYDYTNFVNNIKSYIAALLYPEDYIDKGVKLPSELGGFSFCYGFKEVVDFAVSEEGQFNLIWYPNILASKTINTDGVPNRGATYATVGGVLYYYYGTKRIMYQNDDDTGKWSFPANHNYGSAMDGYRLVSASIKIKYVGTNINKSGYIVSIPTYKDLPCLATLEPEHYGYTMIGGMPFLSKDSFYNTRGCDTSFTLNKNQVCRRVYIPTDPCDKTYEDPGYYYSTAGQSQQGPKTYLHEQEGQQDGVIQPYVNSNTGQTVYGRILKPEEGNPLKYCFIGSNFNYNNQAKTIHVEAYYNFECLPSEGIRVATNAGPSDNVTNEIKNEILIETSSLIDNPRKKRTVNNIYNNIARRRRWPIQNTRNNRYRYKSKW
jgi:hypothetical protein